MMRSVNRACQLVPWRGAQAIPVLFAATAIGCAQTLTTLYNFDAMYGGYAKSALVQATDGDLYGTTSAGGSTAGFCGPAIGCGAIYKITLSGTPTIVYNFCSEGGSVCPDGVSPYAGLVQTVTGDLYGTTRNGGNFGSGTVFKMTPHGVLTTLHSFCSHPGCADGEWPFAALVQAPSGDFFGTTYFGGANGSGGGTIFKINPSGVLTTLYSFCSQVNCADGGNPYAGLVLAASGDLYGTTSCGGAGFGLCPDYGGTVFTISPEGPLTTLYSFCSQFGCTDGSNPDGGVLGYGGNFYGTTAGGGANGGGSIFEITPAGSLTTLYSFGNPAQGVPAGGDDPYAGLVLGTDGNFYGTTEVGGEPYGAGDGTIFKIAPEGTLTTLYTFCTQANCADGAVPDSGMVQATDGAFYGTTTQGGTDAYGTAYRLDVGLGPFVKTLPTSGKVAKAVQILGTDLAGATNVSFNGVAAAFTVVSKSLIKTTVPVGATTGFVTVTTTTGILKSNVRFSVL